MRARTGHPRICAVCEASYYKSPSRTDMTCSPECGDLYRARRSGRKKEGTFRTCSVCQKAFYRPPSHFIAWPNRTCSRKCAAVLRLRGTEHPCKQCGTMFYPTPNHRRRGWGLYCSRSCWREVKSRFRALHGKNHFTIEERRAWRGTECVRCGATDTLQLDHINPRFAGGLPVRENAQTLCRRCNSHKYWKEDLPRYEASLAAAKP